MELQNCSKSKRRKLENLNLSSPLSDDNCEEALVCTWKKSLAMFNKPRSASLIIDTDESDSSAECDTDDSFDTFDGDGSIYILSEMNSECEDELQLFKNLVISKTPETPQEDILQQSYLGFDILKQYNGRNKESVEPMDIETDSKILKIKQKKSDKESDKENKNNRTYWKNHYYSDGCIYLQEMLKDITDSSSKSYAVKPFQKRKQSHNFDEDQKRASKRYCKNLYNHRVKSSIAECDSNEEFLFRKQKYRKKKVSLSSSTKQACTLTSNETERKKNRKNLAKKLKHLPSSSIVKNILLNKN